MAELPPRWACVRAVTYPDITIEIDDHYGLTDIVSERFDAGVRLGEQVDEDMIAVRISPDIPMSLVGSASYFDQHPIPKHPQELVQHCCLNLRLPTSGGVYIWGFANADREMKVHTEGPIVFNRLALIREAALAGFVLCCMLTDQVQPMSMTAL